ALLLPHDPQDRAGHGPPAPRGPERHGGVLRRRLLVPRDLLDALLRARRGPAERVPGRCEPGGRRAPAVPREAGHQTRQESRSGPSQGVPSVSDMTNITIHYAFLPHTDAEAA